MAQQLRPDLVVLRSDFVVDAHALCASLRGSLPKTQLLLLTDFVGKADSDSFEGLYDARLVQPVDTPQLLATVACLLEIRTRRGPRAPLDSLVHLAGFGVEQEGGSTVANAIDVSEHGLLVEASEHLGLGARGTVRFFVPGHSAAVVAVGTVSVAMDEVLLHYAINFDQIDEPARASLARYVTGQIA
jgi:hypothetical protein